MRAAARGEVPERLNGLVSKTSEPSGSVGSNPTLSVDILDSVHSAHIDRHANLRDPPKGGMRTHPERSEARGFDAAGAAQRIPPSPLTFLTASTLRISIAMPIYATLQRVG